MKKEIKNYEPPRIITYSEEDLMEIIGPAQTCTTAFN